MRNAVVNLQLIDKRAGEREVNILAIMLDSYDSSKFFDNSRKHISLFSIVNKKGARTDDLVKTPVSHDMGALCLCNPPALLKLPYTG